MKDLGCRTMDFAVGIVDFVEALPRSATGKTIGRQLIRSGTSVGANYSEACRAESQRDFVHKIALVEKEAAETLYWLELCLHTGLGNFDNLATLRKELDEFVAIFTNIGRKAKQRLANK